LQENHKTNPTKYKTMKQTTNILLALAATSGFASAATIAGSHTTNFDNAFNINTVGGGYTSWQTADATNLNTSSTDAAIAFAFTFTGDVQGSSGGPQLDADGVIIDGNANHSMNLNASTAASGTQFFTLTATGTADLSVVPAGATGISVTNEMITISFDNVGIGASGGSAFTFDIIDAADAGNNVSGTSGTYGSFADRSLAANWNEISFDPTDPGAVAGNNTSRSFNYGGATGTFGLGEALKAGGTISYTYDIEFTPVPEPSSAALLGLGGLALILRRRK